MRTQSRLEPFRSWLTLLGATVICFANGTVYCYGNIVPYSASYVRKYARDRNSSIESITGGSLTLGSVGLGMCVGTLLASRFGCRKVIAAAGFVYTLATLGLALSLQVSFSLFLFTFSGVLGFASGLASGPTVLLAITWLPNRKGLASGISQGGYALSPVVFNPLETWFINPGNEPPDQTVSVGQEGRYIVFYTQDSILRRVPYCFVVQAGIAGLLIFIGLMLIRDPPSVTDDEEMDTLLDRDAQNPEVKDDNTTSLSVSGTESDLAMMNSDSNYRDSIHTEGQSLTHRTEGPSGRRSGRARDVTEMSTLTNSSTTAGQKTIARNEGSVPPERSWSFSGLSVETRHIFRYLYTWQILSVCASNIICGQSFLSVYKTFGETFIDDDMFLAVVGCVSAISNVLGHVVGGYALDCLRVKDVLPTIPAVLSALLLSVSASVYGGKTMYFLWNCGILAINGVFFAAVPVFIIRAYGAQHFVSNLSFIFFSWFCFGISGSLVMNWIQDFFSWPNMFILLGSLPGGAMLFSMFMNIKNPRGHYI